MKDYGSCDDEGEEEVEGKESGECGVVNREAASDSLNEGVTYVRDG